MEYHPTSSTQALLLSIFIPYLLYLARCILSRRLDLYDAIALSSIGVIPIAFAFFPALITALANRIGIGLPLFLLFGSLQFISFLLAFRIIRRAEEMSHRQIALIREVALLGTEIQKLKSQRNWGTECRPEPIEKADLSSRE